jgi:acetyl esterase/lipase
MPDYRLSLEAPYPAGLNDCYDALLWAKAHASKLGVRDDQIIIAGDSSGANMAVACCLMARDRKDVQIACQIILYPCLDDTMQSESMRDNNSPVVDSTGMYFCWKYYLGELFGTDDVPIYAAPLRATDFSSLPPAIGFVGGVDPLRDDAAEYFKHLEASGVPTQFRVFEGGYHGFEEFCPKAEVSKLAHAFFLEAYRDALDNYFAEQRK